MNLNVLAADYVAKLKLSASIDCSRICWCSPKFSAAKSAKKRCTRIVAKFGNSQGLVKNFYNLGNIKHKNGRTKMKPTKTLNKLAIFLTLIILMLGTSAVYPIVIRHDQTRVFRQHDEVGKIVTFVGRGYLGNGKEGVKAKDMILRGAHNRVETADEKWVSFIFDATDSLNVLQMEGTSGPGDSCSPALIEDAAKSIQSSKVKTNDKISKYFKDVPVNEPDIALHNLLTHSAGLIDVLSLDYDKLTRDEMNKNGLVSKMQTILIEKYDYSNLGYRLLAATIEILTRNFYERYLPDNLFKPAAMNETEYLLPKWKCENLAVDHQKDRSRWRTPLERAWDGDNSFWNPHGNNPILMRVGDLYKWQPVLKNEQSLSKEAEEKYFGPHNKEQPAKTISFYG
jgi:hypothetical protein